LEDLNTPLLKQLLQAEDFRVRSAAVRVLRYHLDRVSDSASLLTTAVADPHGRVRLEAIVAASWLDNADAHRILEIATLQPTDQWSENALKTAQARLSDRNGTTSETPDTVAEKPQPAVPKHLSRDAVDRFLKGHEIYHREGHCTTCHQPDGQGLPAAGFPPLAGTKWVNGDEKRLIQITLHGLMGPLEVKGVAYPGQVPMTPFGGMLDDEEIASVLTYVRNSFGNESSPVSPARVESVRQETADKVGFYQTSDFQE
jgi:mono/diheme cytochrome c family protein